MHFDFQILGILVGITMEDARKRCDLQQEMVRFSVKLTLLQDNQIARLTSGFKKDVINYQSRTILNIFNMRRSFSSIIRNTMKTEL